MVRGNEQLMPLIDDGVSRKDKHVAAVAAKCRASWIVTFNHKDFKGRYLEDNGIVAIDPDDFLVDMLRSHPNLQDLMDVFEGVIANLTNPPISPKSYASSMRMLHQLPRSSALITVMGIVEELENRLVT